MEIKLFEVRDEGTTIAAIAVRVDYADPTLNDAERWLLGRSGYRTSTRHLYTLFGSLDENHLEYDPQRWRSRWQTRGSGTMARAHEYVHRHWDELETGAVICCEFLRGERTSPKVSDRLAEQGIRVGGE